MSFSSFLYTLEKKRCLYLHCGKRLFCPLRKACGLIGKDTFFVLCFKPESPYNIYIAPLPNAVATITVKALLSLPS